MGVQAVGRYGDEASLLALAAVLEQEAKWADRHPPVSAWASRPSVESNRR
jgi:amidase